MKSKYFLILFAVTIIFSACKKNFEPKIYGSLTQSNFPQSQADFEAYMLEVYKPFQAKWGYQTATGFQDVFNGYEYSDIQLNDATGDDIAHFPEWGGFFDFLSASNFKFMINQDRSSHFEKVRFVTLITKIITDLENAKIDATAKAEYIGEAKMARGWLMYHLLTMYGPVPVITDETKLGTDAESNLTRPDEASFATQIEKDLQDAADALPRDAAEYGRFNKGIALTVLMRAYLYEKDYANAEKAGRQILTMGYSLVPDYISLFTERMERNNETIFAVSVDPNADGSDAHGNMNAWTFYCYPADFPGHVQKGGWASPNGAYTATWAFYDSFDPNDARRQMLVPSYTNLSGQLRDRSNMRGPVIAKFPDDDKGTAFQGNDIALARYADVLLLLAEAINQNSGPTAEAVGFVNKVRERAGIPDLGTADIADKQSFANSILRERSWELFFEGFRRIDLIRFGKWPSALQNVAEKNPGPALLPVPQYALDESKGALTQTSGY